jgi:hypothetical protein
VGNSIGRLFPSLTSQYNRDITVLTVLFQRVGRTTQSQHHTSSIQTALNLASPTATGLFTSDAFPQDRNEKTRLVAVLSPLVVLIVESL